MIYCGEEPRVLSSTQGRIRLQLPDSASHAARLIEDRLDRIDGVESVRANPLTGSVLIRFNHRILDAEGLKAKLGLVLEELAKEEWPASGGQFHTRQPARSGSCPLRVVVRGLLGHALVDSLWFGAGFLGSAVGLPVSGLGALHLLADIAVWTLALGGEQDHVEAPKGNYGGRRRRPARQSVCPA